MAQIWVAAREASLILGLSLLGRGWDLYAARHLPLAGHLDADVLVVEAGSAAVASSALSGPSLLVLGDASPGLDLGPGGVVLPEPQTIEDVAEGIEQVLHDRAGAAAASKWARIIDLDDPDATVSVIGNGEVQLHLDLGEGVLRSPTRWKHRETTGMGSAPEVVSTEPSIFSGRGDRRSGIGRVIGRQDASRANDEADFERRLGRVLFAATELEALLDEYPRLRDRRSVADVVVADAAELLAADTAALWEWCDGSWMVTAARGLTLNQQRLRPDANQPVFREVHATGGGVLIERTAGLVSAVYDIGGAGTVSLAATAIAAGQHRYGILCVGRNEVLTHGELDALVALSREAAPLLATARLIERLSRQNDPT